MGLLENMPPIVIDQNELRAWGTKWLLNRAFAKKDGIHFTAFIDRQVGTCLATMLGGIEIARPKANELMPKGQDTVEVGPVRVVGGIRPQNYDVGYRPDGVRFVCDSKTLNDTESVGKNFQNMINDLGAEATTVHMRFPYAIVAFVVVIPVECYTGAVRLRFTRMLDRLVGRNSPIDVPHKAEAVALVLWDPATGTIDATWPPPDSPLRIERFSENVQTQYYSRYAGMPPHNTPTRAQKKAAENAGEAIPEEAAEAEAVAEAEEE